MTQHTEEIYDIEYRENVELTFSDGTELSATLISESVKDELLFDVEGYDNVLSVKVGRTHQPAIIRPGLEGFGYVTEVN